MPARGVVGPVRLYVRTVTTARVVADYVAGMTDRFAIQEHRNLFDTVLWR